MTDLAIAILAAGQSRRLGRPKQLVAHRGQTLVRHAAGTALAAELGPVAVVLGAHAGVVAQELRELPARALMNPAWPTGMASSVRRAAEWALELEARALLLMVCDQPGVDAMHLRALALARVRSRREVAATAYGGALGVPALFASGVLGELLELQGDTGARRVIARDPARVASVTFEPGALDIDTEADVARLGAQ